MTKQSFGVPTNQSQPSVYGGVVTNQPYNTGGMPVPNPLMPAPPIQSQPLPLDPYAQQHYNQTPMSPSVPPPPPPSSASAQGPSSSRPPSVGPHSKSKYIIDPSVKSGPGYGSSYSSPTQTMYGGMQQTQNYASPGNFPAQQHQQQQPYQQQPVGGYGNFGSATAQNTIYNPAEPELQQRQSQPALLNPAPVKPQAMFNPNITQSNVTGTSVSAPPSSLSQQIENSSQFGSQTSGWNDPPVTNKANKSLVNYYIQLFNLSLNVRIFFFKLSLCEFR